MFLKFYLLYVILRLITGNPIVAIVVVLLLFYVIDRRFIGLLPNLLAPFGRLRKVRMLERQIELNPHDLPAKYDLAQSYMARGQFSRALRLLSGLSSEMKSTPDVDYDIAVCEIETGQIDAGKRRILSILSENPLLRYGEPYLTLARVEMKPNPVESVKYLEEFQKYNFSSCESYYKMAQLHRILGNRDAAKAALDSCIETYRSLPKFRRKHERTWARKAKLQRIFA